MALQEFDLGYRLFVKDKMADLRQEQRAAGPSMQLRAGQLQALPLPAPTGQQPGQLAGASIPRGAGIADTGRWRLPVHPACQDEVFGGRALLQPS